MQPQKVHLHTICGVEFPPPKPYLNKKQRYLLWGMVATGHPDVEVVYQALINGPTADCWGSFAEAYSREGAPNDHDLRTFETGCNLSAVASYWKLGTTKQKGTTHEQAELRAEERNHPPAIHRTEKAAAEAVEEPA